MVAEGIGDVLAMSPKFPWSGDIAFDAFRAAHTRGAERRVDRAKAASSSRRAIATLED